MVIQLSGSSWIDRATTYIRRPSGEFASASGRDGLLESRVKRFSAYRLLQEWYAGARNDTPFQLSDVAGDDGDRRLRVVLPHVIRELDASHVRHAHVRHDRVDGHVLFQDFDG